MATNVISLQRTSHCTHGLGQHHQREAKDVEEGEHHKGHGGSHPGPRVILSGEEHHQDANGRDDKDHGAVEDLDGDGPEHQAQLRGAHLQQC